MRVPAGLKPKDLCGIPWRVAFALQDDGWWLRSDIIWAKGSARPESVTDRPTKAHEYIFLLTKKAHYWYDAEAIREPTKSESHERANRAVNSNHKNISVPGQSPQSLHKARANGDGYAMPPTRNKRTVWHVNPKGYDQQHYATYPMALIDPCVKAGCPPKVCAECGAPWERVVEKVIEYDHVTTQAGKSKKGPYMAQTGNGAGTHDIRHGVYSRHKTIDWQPTCTCNAETRPGIVLDMFMGAGTTALVAIQNDRHYIGCDLNQEYVDMARQRIQNADPYQPTDHANGTRQLSLFSA